MGELYNISKYIYSIARLGSGTATNCFKCDYCKRFFLTNLDGGVCQRDLNEYELSCCGGIMLCLAVSIVV